MILGLLILACGALALIPLESWVHRNLRGIPDKLAEHVYLPLARVILIMGFLYAVFPAPMFNAEVLRPVQGLALAGPAWKGLLNVLFLVALMLPLFPQTQQFGAIILPLQSLLGVWLFVGHFEQQSGLTLQLGGAGHAAWLPIFAGALVASHLLLQQLCKTASQLWSLDALTLYDSIVLVAQPPLVLLVSRSFVLAT